MKGDTPRNVPPRNLRTGQVASKATDDQTAHAERDRARAKRSALEVLKAVKRKGHYWPGER
jgi:hypothetical protein